MVPAIALDKATVIEYQNSWVAQQAREHRDIGFIPPVKDESRRQAASRNLRLFLETYFPHTFALAWSDYHTRLIDLIQRAILEGLQQSIGFPRGSGKTSICQRAVLWATLCGHRKFAMLFSAEESKTKQHTKAIWDGLSQNEHLMEDFPEICYPFRKTDGNAIRASRQLCNGVETRIEFNKLGMVFPTLADSVRRGNSGAIIGLGTVCGSASRGPIIRGIRPDLALIDDPQTRLSAKSPTMVRDRLNSISGDILGMAGPGKDLAVLLTCTVIYRDDLADMLLDRGKHPEWHGIRVKMLESMPTDMSLWDEWAGIIRECQLNELPYDRAHKFYRKHKKEMRKGAKVYWEARRLKGFVDALESAMFLRYRDPVNFMSEYQNEPETLTDEDESLPSPDIIARQYHWCRRKIVPNRCDCLTAFIDVQQKLLFYAVVGWEKENFTGFVIDYGTWPDQKRRHFTKRDAKVTVGHKKRGAGWDACLRNALNELILNDLSGGYVREDGVEMKIERGMIDANWSESTDVVYTFLKQNKLFPTWMPSHGIYLKAGSVGINEKKKGSNEKRGQHWKFTRHQQYMLFRCIYDTNWWKSFHAARWRTTVGDPGSMYLFTERVHDLFASHLSAEVGITVEARGKRTTEWRVRTGDDNDWLDCMVGNCVAASQLGCRTRSIEPVIDGTRPRLEPITMENVASFYG